MLDVDGTILDSGERLLISYASVVERWGGEMLDLFAFIAAYREQRLPEESGVAPGDVPGFYADLFDAFATLEPFGSAIPGAPEALAALHAGGARLAIATAVLAPEERLREALAAAGFTTPLDVVVTGRTLGRRPTDMASFTEKREMLAATLAALGTDPSEAAFATDWPSELEDARAAGIPVRVGVTTGIFAADELPAATHVLGSVAEIPGALGIGPQAG